MTGKANMAWRGVLRRRGTRGAVPDGSHGSHGSHGATGTRPPAGPLAEVRRRAVWAGAVGIGAAGSLAVVAFAGSGHGYPEQNVNLLSGSAWLASSQAGQVTLLDGASNEVAAQVQIAQPGHTIDVVQQGPNAYAIDRTAGTLRRVDGATFALTPPASPIPGAAAGLTAFADPHAVYALDTQRGLLATSDPHTLAPDGPPISLAAQLSTGSATLDDSGRLWLIDNTTGDLTWAAGGQRGTQRGVARPGHSLLTLVNGNPVVVDTVDRKAITVDPSSGAPTGSFDLDLRPKDTVSVSGSPHGNRLYVVDSRGVLDICDVTKGSCDNTVPLDSNNNQLGAAIEAGNRLFVPDYTTGQVWVIDMDRHTVVATAQVLSPPVPFQLLTRDGVVFFNDPNSERAGVVRLDGGVTQIAKYDPADPSKGLQGDKTPSATGAPTATGTPANSAQPPPAAQQNQQHQAGQQPPKGGSPVLPPNGPPPVIPPTGGGGGPPTTTNPPAPTLHITLSNNNPTIGQDVTLSVSADTGTPTSAHWDFGDGQTGDGVTVTHHWASQQTYQVTVQVVMTGGGQGDTSVSISVDHPATATIPNVVGQAQATARQNLTNAGFAVATTSMVSNSIAAGVVMYESPTASTTAAWGSTVNLTVSAGKTPTYNLTTHACEAQWTSYTGGNPDVPSSRPCPGSDTSQTGFVSPQSGCATFSDGSNRCDFLEAAPAWTGAAPYMIGTYKLPQPVIAGDHLQAQVGFVGPATGNGDAWFTLVAVMPDGTSKEVYSIVDLKATDARVRSFNVNLSSVAGAVELWLGTYSRSVSGGSCPTAWINPTFGG